MRSVAVAYILWFFLGLIGVHRFYCNRIGTGILWLLTGGLFTIGWIIDLFLVPGMVRQANLESKVFGAAGAPRPTPDVEAAGRAPMAGRAGASAGHRVIYCTRCGQAMQVPEASGGQRFACPGCHEVVAVPG